MWNKAAKHAPFSERVALCVALRRPEFRGPTFASDDEHHSHVVRMRDAQEVAECVVGFALRETMQIEPSLDHGMALGQALTQAAFQLRERRRIARRRAMRQRTRRARDMLGRGIRRWRYLVVHRIGRHGTQRLHVPRDSSPQGMLVGTQPA